MHPQWAVLDVNEPGRPRHQRDMKDADCVKHTSSSSATDAAADARGTSQAKRSAERFGSQTCKLARQEKAMFL